MTKYPLPQNQNLNAPIRFFIFEDCGIDDESEVIECSEQAFLNAPADWPITYERHTVFANGVSQVCLTKMPKG